MPHSLIRFCLLLPVSVCAGSTATISKRLFASIEYDIPVSIADDSLFNKKLAGCWRSGFAMRICCALEGCQNLSAEVATSTGKIKPADGEMCWKFHLDLAKSDGLCSNWHAASRAPMLYLLAKKAKFKVIQNIARGTLASLLQKFIGFRCSNEMKATMIS